MICICSISMYVHLGMDKETYLGPLGNVNTKVGAELCANTLFCSHQSIIWYLRYITIRSTKGGKKLKPCLTALAAKKWSFIIRNLIYYNNTYATRLFNNRF